jgi:hypothetical protein
LPINTIKPTNTTQSNNIDQLLSFDDSLAPITQNPISIANIPSTNKNNLDFFDMMSANTSTIPVSVTLPNLQAFVNTLFIIL